uniref:Cupin type-1 domain-containing protein n=1 Tax=Araucaria cunninghamii TaxID=56994 RepID=A0A0D6R9R4_ARACU
MINMVYNPNPYKQRQHEIFYVGGGRNPPTMLSAFSGETLEAAFKVRREDIEKVFRRQDNGTFQFLSEQERRKIMDGDDIQRPSFTPLRSRRAESEEEYSKPFNMKKKEAKYSNENGWHIEAGCDDFRPLGRQEDRNSMGISYTIIKPGKMTVPYWNTHSTKISVVLRGRGRIEIASPEGVTEQWRGDRSGESESEREKQKEGEEFRVSYRRVEDNLKVGDVFVIPAGYPSVQIANSNEGFEFMSFHTNFDRNDDYFVAGKNSLLNELQAELLAKDFDVEKKEELKKLIGSQEKEVFVDGPKASQRWSIL